MTPLQMAAAYAAIANDGVMVQPHLVRNANAPWSRRVVSEKVAAELRTMLTVTVEDGTGKQAQVDGYEVAGKTGTAQKVKENGGGYADDRFVASFVGMVPAATPRLVILVTVDEPTTEHLGPTSLLRPSLRSPTSRSRASASLRQAWIDWTGGLGPPRPWDHTDDRIRTRETQ